MQSTPYSCRILIKLEFSRQTFEKKSQISNCIKTRPDRQADRRTNGRDESDSRFFRNHVNTPENLTQQSRPSNHHRNPTAPKKNVRLLDQIVRLLLFVPLKQGCPTRGALNFVMRSLAILVNYV